MGRFNCYERIVVAQALGLVGQLPCIGVERVEINQNDAPPGIGCVEVNASQLPIIKAYASVEIAFVVRNELRGRHGSRGRQRIDAG